MDARVVVAKCFYCMEGSSTNVDFVTIPNSKCHRALWAIAKCSPRQPSREPPRQSARELASQPVKKTRARQTAACFTQQCEIGGGWQKTEWVPLFLDSCFGGWDVYLTNARTRLPQERGGHSGGWMKSVWEKAHPIIQAKVWMEETKRSEFEKGVGKQQPTTKMDGRGQRGGCLRGKEGTFWCTSINRWEWAKL